jgi:hypothetical protein
MYWLAMVYSCEHMEVQNTESVFDEIAVGCWMVDFVRAANQSRLEEWGMNWPWVSMWQACSAVLNWALSSSDHSGLCHLVAGLGGDRCRGGGCKQRRVELRGRLWCVLACDRSELEPHWVGSPDVDGWEWESWWVNLWDGGGQWVIEGMTLCFWLFGNTS